MAKQDHLHTDWWHQRRANAVDLTGAYERFQGPAWRQRRSVWKEAALGVALALALLLSLVSMLNR